MNAWSYDLDRELYLTEEALCTPSTPTALVRCCRVWLIAADFHVRRCGLCGDVPEHFDLDDETNL